jgi:hypothetical protein
VVVGSERGGPGVVSVIVADKGAGGGGCCKGNLTDLRRILHLSLAKGNPK